MTNTKTPKQRLQALRKAAKRRSDAVVVAWCDLALDDARPHVRQEAISELSRMGAL